MSYQERKDAAIMAETLRGFLRLGRAERRRQGVKASRAQLEKWLAEQEALAGLGLFRDDPDALAAAIKYLGGAA